MTMAELPLELISSILRLLPAKSLLRFKCISKSICGIIDSSDFIKSHLKTNSANRTHRKFICQGGDGNDNHLGTFLIFDMDDVFCPVLNTNRCFQPEFRYLRHYDFYAHCNGLVLLNEDRNLTSSLALGVWNPATRQYRKLPLLPNESPSLDCTQSILGLGFGYDSCLDDYKVLQIVQITTFRDRYHRIHFDIWILGLRSGYWRKIENFPLDNKLILVDLDESHGIPFGCARNCFVDGALHFLCSGAGVILAFDVAKETFSQLNLPSFDPIEERPYGLQVFEGSLCISFLVDNEAWIEVRLLNKDRVGYSWTELLSTSNELFDSVHWNLLKYSREGDKILMFDKGYLYSYDIKQEIAHRIEFGDIGGLFIYNRNAVFGIESLVPLYYPPE